MLIADEKDKVNTFRVAALTGASIFVMGYVNAMALNTHDLGTMITPQTGNVIWLGLNAASGYWTAFFENFSLFMGFILGIAFAVFTQSSFANKRIQFYFNWSVFVVPVMAYPILLQYMVPPWVSFLTLGFSAGTALGFFRRMYHLEINNAMATGNVRFLGLHFLNAFLRKNTKGDKKELLAFWIFFICVFLFAFGAFLYGMFARLDYVMDLDTVLGLARQGNGRLAGDANIALGHDRLSLGMRSGRVLTSNLVRYIGLVVICLIPYGFCPKYGK